MRKFLLIAGVVACTSSNDERLLTKSTDIHDLAIKTGKRVSEKIQTVATHTEQLDEPLKSLLRDSVMVLTKDYAYWESTIIEVGGHEQRTTRPCRTSSSRSLTRPYSRADIGHSKRLKSSNRSTQYSRSKITRHT
ncbi:MAG: hypothetical protein KI790_01265 [Cyclobacteriaceae bacterium]|nr:hypothetical protein [Cyclobacteriaceae bacterium HetDA_MAG_MS6]